MHIESPLPTGLIGDIDAYSATLTGPQLGKRGEVSPALFEN